MHILFLLTKFVHNYAFLCVYFGPLKGVEGRGNYLSDFGCSFWCKLASLASSMCTYDCEEERNDHTYDDCNSRSPNPD